MRGYLIAPIGPTLRAREVIGCFPESRRRVHEGDAMYLFPTYADARVELKAIDPSGRRLRIWPVEVSVHPAGRPRSPGRRGRASR